jgi:hypothetical protein
MSDDLVNEARLDAKAFRENTVYDSEGDPIRLIANANRLDQYADRIEALTAENERLREVLRGVTPPAHFGESEQSKAWWAKARAALGDTQ